MEPTKLAGQTITLLPQTVACVAFMGFVVGLVNAGAVDEVIEGCLVGALVNTAATFVTPQVALG